MKKLFLFLMAVSLAAGAQTLVLNNGVKGSNQEFRPGPAGVIIHNLDGTDTRLGQDLIGGSNVGASLAGLDSGVTNANGLTFTGNAGLFITPATPASGGETFYGVTSGSCPLTVQATGGVLNLCGTNASITPAGALIVTSCTGCPAVSYPLQAPGAGLVAYSFAPNANFGIGYVAANGGGLMLSSSANPNYVITGNVGLEANAAYGMYWVPTTVQVAITNTVDTAITRAPGGGMVSLGTVQTAGNATAFLQQAGSVRVTANFTTAANTSLQTITGLTWTPTNPQVQAINYSLSCDLAYSQATAAAAVAFGIQAATNAPTNIMITGTEQISAGPPSTYVSGTLATLATTTATAIVSGTPGALGTNYTVHLGGAIELPGSANTINVMVSTAVSGDAVTVLKDSTCRLWPTAN